MMKSYKLHTHHYIDKDTKLEPLTDEMKENFLQDLITYFEVLLLQRKGWSEFDIHFHTMVDDGVEISVDDENGKTKRDIQRLILTLNLLTSWYGEFLDE